MAVSVIIPVYNAGRTLERCLESLRQQTSRDFEVILVDNNSSDRSMEIARGFRHAFPDFRLELLSEPRQGATMARNTGARAARGAVIANIDPDCLAEPTWIDDLTRIFADSDVAAVAGNIEPHPAGNVYEKFSALFTLPGHPVEQLYRSYDLRTGGFATANLAIRRDWFERVGGFAEEINYRGVGIGEDHDLCARLYARGGQLLATPRATVHHWHRSSFGGMLRQGFLFGLAHALLLDRHGRRSTLIDAGPLQLRVPTPFRGWISFDCLDKRLLLLALPAVFAWSLALPAAYAAGSLALPAAYLGFVFWRTRRRCSVRGIACDVPESLAMLPLLLGKCLATSAGRLRGSFAFRVLCL